MRKTNSPEFGPDGTLNAIEQALVMGKDEELLVILQHVCHIVLHSLDLQADSPPSLGLRKKYWRLPQA